jgi:hypothetical protein
MALKLLSLLYIFIDLSPEHEHKLFVFKINKQLHHFLWPFIILIHSKGFFLLSFLKSILSSSSSLSSEGSGIYE